MRDLFETNFSVTKSTERNMYEGKENPGDLDIRGAAVSSNGYYGYQSLPQKEENHEACESMDVQINESDIQFNNFIETEDRLSCSHEINSMRGLRNRKRPCVNDNVMEFKKRRENDLRFNTSLKKSDTELLKRTIDYLTEQLLQEIHGCSTYHWTYDDL